MGVSSAALKSHTLPALIDQSVALARYANVSVKLSASPLFSSEPYPFRDVTPQIRRLFDAIDLCIPIFVHGEVLVAADRLCLVRVHAVRLIAPDVGRMIVEDLFVEVLLGVHEDLFASRGVLEAKLVEIFLYAQID